jgi:hypothetical protein
MVTVAEVLLRFGHWATRESLGNDRKSEFFCCVSRLLGVAEWKQETGSPKQKPVQGPGKCMKNTVTDFP